MGSSRILIIGPSWVGDMLMSQSLYRQLKIQHPNCEIDVLAPDWCRGLIERMPEIANSIAMPVGHGSLQWGVRKRLAAVLEKRGYDQAIVLPNSFKSALIPWLAQIPLRTGWLGEMRYVLLNDPRKLDKAAFPRMVERYVALAGKGVRRASELPAIVPPRLTVSSEGQRTALAEFDLPPEGLVGLCPGAEFGPAKRWPDYHYAALASRLIADGKQVACFGSAKDAEVVETIREQLPDEQQAAFHGLAGRTSLPQAIDLLAACEAVVTNDSGLMHVAAAVETPLVALYGPTSPEFTPPLSDRAEVIRLIDGYLKVRKGEAEAGYHQSMIDIKPEQVLDALKRVLAQ
ncbi:lipopolysaccharide heptosyltransferase II [Aestuariicella hydrocarbonica]|uniref:lipopolysaccharide heptosyltransferase II n=1 Tax=Pseudomaricurvus hydrocarbonicus TaxID=1470433 RepID=A0A9E5JTH8_9GAMM|nr:lipopolysaccharide heptosyltransferase II [Aestuariicella hydrocarbonica]NHO66552.1 lipopolysaccharide heptosyltransferase II [Aestuariicella hydrocarbonica]